MKELAAAQFLLFIACNRERLCMDVCAVYACSCTSHDPNNLLCVFKCFVAFVWVIDLIDSCPSSILLFFCHYGCPPLLSSPSITTSFLFSLHIPTILPPCCLPSFLALSLQPPHILLAFLTASQSSPYALDEQ